MICDVYYFWLLLHYYRITTLLLAITTNYYIITTSLPHHYYRFTFNNFFWNWSITTQLLCIIIALLRITTVSLLPITTLANLLLPITSMWGKSLVVMDPLLPITYRGNLEMLKQFIMILKPWISAAYRGRPCTIAIVGL